MRVWQTQSSALWTGEAQLTVLLPLHCLLRLVSFSVVLKQFEWLTVLKFDITFEVFLLSILVRVLVFLVEQV